MENKLKQARLKNNFTQQDAAKFLKMSLRSYKTYENDKSKMRTMKYEYILNKLNENTYIDENHGLLTIDEIEKAVNDVFKEYDVKYCYLFGSYAKKKENEKSDVDLLISTSTTGLKFYGLVEKIREKLNKKVDLLNVDQLKNNTDLLNEVLKDGIRIYKQK